MISARAGHFFLSFFFLGFHLLLLTAGENQSAVGSMEKGGCAVHSSRHSFSIFD
jgi:hypothetical protein